MANSAISKNGEFGSATNSAWSASPDPEILPPGSAWGGFPTRGTDRSPRYHTRRPSKTLLSRTTAPSPQAGAHHQPPTPTRRPALTAAASSAAQRQRLAPPAGARPSPAPRPRRGRAARASARFTLRRAALRRGHGHGRSLQPGGPSPQRFLRGFPEGGGHDPAAAHGSRPASGRAGPGRHRCPRALLPRATGAGAGRRGPPQVEGGLRPLPGRPRLLAPAPGRAAGSGRGAPAAPRSPSTSLRRARYVSDRGAREKRGESPARPREKRRRRRPAGPPRFPGCPSASGRRKPRGPPSPAEPGAARRYLSKSSRIMKMQKARGKAR